MRVSISLGLGALVLAGVLYAPQLQVHDVSVSGAHAVSADAVAAAVESYLDGRVWGIMPKRHIAVLAPAAISAYITRSFPRLKDVHVARQFPRTLALTVSERDLWGVICREGESATGSENPCYYVDSSGVVVEPAPQLEGAVVRRIGDFRGKVYTPGAEALSPRTLVLFEIIPMGLERALGVGARQFSVGTEYQAHHTIITDEGWYMTVDEETDARLALENLLLVLRKEVNDRSKLEYIDLRFPSKVFYKQKGN